GISVNKNTVPFDPRSPFDPSGIRLGTPALTTRGMKEPEMKRVAVWIDEAVKHYSDEKYLQDLHAEITKFSQDFPLPS
ncbi:serine hydroxymethyltransferase, partial [Candidatus Saccharibacteria bacterium]|nr:serine hydroxymethyltransferase [Candidatus Saccharibacteria bacterium]